MVFGYFNFTITITVYIKVDIEIRPTIKGIQKGKEKWQRVFSCHQELTKMKSYFLYKNPSKTYLKIIFYLISLVLRPLLPFLK
jgi:hypothetical protein